MQEKGQEVLKTFAFFLGCYIAGTLIGKAIAKFMLAQAKPPEEDFTGE